MSYKKQIEETITYLNEKKKFIIKDGAIHISKKGIKEGLVEKAGYEEFFKNAMKKFKIKNINDLSDKEKDKFFTYIDKNWEAENE